MSLRLALPFLLLAGAASAQQVDCANAMAQVELTYCAEQDWLAADEGLNAAYKQARQMMREIDAWLPAGQQGAEAQLRDAQRAWITFRDANCAAEGYQFHGGSAEQMVVYGCRARLTEARTADLQLLGQP